MSFRRIFLLVITLMILLTACSTRGIPTISSDTLVSKISVLMISSNKLSDTVKQTIGANLLTWRNANQIAFEWSKDKSTVDETLRKMITSKSYDYIYVIGTDLFPTAIQAAGQDKKGKWTFLQDQFDMQQQEISDTGNTALMQIDPKQVDQLKNNWVDQLLAQGESMEWVTMAEYPIPSLWAPSEEADHIVLLNNNSDWFEQLAHQTKLHMSKKILFNAPVDPSFVQKAKTIGVPVINLSTAIELDLNWDTVLSDRLTIMTGRNWKNGVQLYTPQELKEIKIK